MKNNFKLPQWSKTEPAAQKLIEFDCRMLAEAGATGRGVPVGASHTVICHNLREDSAAGVLRPVGVPAELTEEHFPGATLIAGGSCTLDDGTTTLFALHGDRILAIEHGSASYVEGFSGTVESMVNIGSGMLVVTGGVDDAIELTRRDGKWWAVRVLGAPVPVMMLRRDEGTLSSGELTATLSGSYTSRSAELTPADAQRLGGVLTEAYRSVCDRATALGSFVQPVVARYRIMGCGGRVLYISAPVLIAPDDGVQLTDATFTLSGSGFSQARCSGITAKRFTIELVQLQPLSPEWREVMERIELQLSPQLHPLEEAGVSHCELGRFTTTEGTVSVLLPGVGDRADRVAERVVRPKILNLIGHLDTGALITIGSACYSETSEGAPLWVGLDFPFYPDRCSTAESVSRLRKLLSSPLPERTEEAVAMGALSVPHHLRAEVMAAGGDLVALGRISAVRFEGWTADDFTIASRSGTPVAHGESSCRVIFADGSTRVRSLSGAMGGGGFLSPLICYPAADAVAIELYHGGSYLKFPLTPDPSGRYSLYLQLDLYPVAISPGLGNHHTPSEQPRRVDYPSLVGVAEAALPLTPKAVTLSAHPSPVAISGLAGSAGGWDSGAGRFYLFGAGGVQAMTVGSGGLRVSLRDLDPRPVVSPQGVAEGCGMVTALAGGDIVKVSGQKVTTLLPDAGASGMIGIDGRHQELLCRHSGEGSSPKMSYPQGEEMVSLRPDATAMSLTGRGLYTRSLPALSSMLSIRGAIYATTPEGAILDLTGESPGSGDDARCLCRYSGRVVPGGRSGVRPGVCLVELPLRGEISGGHIEIHGDNGGGPAMASPLAELSLSGYYPHLLPLRLLAPHCHGITLTLSFSASPAGASLG